MTLKEAVLKSLEDIGGITNYSTVYKHVVENNYYDFKTNKTPGNTISAILGDFVRAGDTRVKRIGQEGGTYSYYLTKNESNISIEVLSGSTVSQSSSDQKPIKTETYDERDLHLLLSSYLKNAGIYSKTIFHEQSTYNKDSNQIWTHPDMIGIKFLNLQSNASRNFLKSVNRVDSFKLSSYELKKEINTDAELKKAYFQAVSNSSWANYGYLVAFEFSSGLNEEIERLNQSFGIGVIQLDANPFKTKTLFPAQYRDLDFKTIDKLCKINKDFERFIEHTETVLVAEEKYHKAVEKELDEFCDSYLKTDEQVQKYCQEKHIPYFLEQDLQEG
ncbi:hypothetical protein [Desertivirga brevis]|uniref:hypothetical protein n=1 Tax=Desertivirga brevis TaxID=2810310 RepID=UPI001A95CAC1|nr:hypothetical protein [Pedobacter sp. SYSU D00873]